MVRISAKAPVIAVNTLKQNKQVKIFFKDVYLKSIKVNYACINISSRKEFCLSFANKFKRSIYQKPVTCDKC